MIQARKGSKSPTQIEPPLINFSDEVKRIYKKADTWTINFKGEIIES